MCNISDKEWNEKYLPFYNNANKYLIDYIIPNYVAFYLASAYSRHCLSKCPLKNHINSAIDVFNCNCEVNILISKIINILKIRYNLVINNTNPLQMKRYY